MDQNRQKLAKEWFDSANSDFLYAEIGLKHKLIFPQIAFLSQQIAEKYLKGFLVLHGIKPPRVHDLPILLQECSRINSHLEKTRIIPPPSGGGYRRDGRSPYFSEQ